MKSVKEIEERITIIKKDITYCNDVLNGDEEYYGCEQDVIEDLTDLISYKNALQWVLTSK